MKKLLKWIFVFMLMCIVIITIYVSTFAIAGHMMYEEALKEKPIEEMAEEIKSKANYTKLKEMPDIYIKAVVAAEDHRYYEHLGVDYIAILRAIVNNISLGKLAEGGSTITQQLCKNTYFSQSRKLDRKFAETFMAAEVERVLDKDEILELYINTCFYGNNCYTLKEASNLYYDKEPIDLNDYESTLIAGIPNAPSLYNPIHSMELAKQRQRQVLNKMVRFKYITEEERDRILSMGDETSDNK